MESVIKWIITTGYGRPQLTNLLRKGLTALSAILVTYFTTKGYDPDTISSISLWIVSLAPIVVSFIWETLEKRYNVTVVQTAIAAPASSTVAEITTVAAAVHNAPKEV